MKYLKRILLSLMLIFLFLPVTKASNNVNIYLFYSEFCSTCASEEEWLNEYLEGGLDVNLIKYEVTRNKENASLLQDVRSALKNKDLTTPYTVIGTMGLTGFNGTIKNQIIKAIDTYKTNDYVDIVDVVKNDLDVSYNIDYPETEFDLPIFGNVNPKTASLPIISIVVGFIDGFNPCAMWVLLFLISMLFNMKNKRRMWIIGITFLLASALTYLLFMLAWLQVAINLTSIGWIRLIIGVIALLGGAINLTSYIKERKSDDGCEVVDSKKRKSFFIKIKNIITKVDSTNKNKWGFFIALIGIIGLAISVNLVELACSSGLPLIYTQILAINNLTSSQYFSYILLYILFFLIDDIVIFAIAMKTLTLTGISNKYNKTSHLIGGIIMLIIGLLMILKPDWLMFNF